MNRISSIKVFGLFGIKEDIVEISFLPSISVVYGLDDVGKTMVFKLLNSILMPTKENLDMIAQINFDTIELKFSNEINVTVSKRTFKEDLGKVRQVSGGMISNLLICDDFISAYSDNILHNMTFATDVQREIFKYVIHNPGLVNKYITFDDNGKISVTLDFDGNEYKGYSVDILSKCDKSILLLYYYLITKIPNKVGTSYLQLIDTPEIYMLGGSFLMRFIDNLMYINDKLGRGKEFQYVIATQTIDVTYKHDELACVMCRVKED